MSSILYYPFINVPKTDWTLRTLLYYDNVYSIVPSAYREEPEKFETGMLELVKEELVIAVDPKDALKHYYNLEDPFIAFLKQHEKKLAKNQKLFKNQLKEIHHMSELYGAKIHVGKFNESVFRALVDMGLAKRQLSDPYWYWVEENTANLLMKYLAQLMSLYLDLLPVTDSLNKPLSIRKKQGASPYVLRKHRSKREAILKELIPFAEQISIPNLRRFKDDYRSLLEPFRNQVELIVLDDALEEDSPLLQQRVRELLIHKEELVRRLEERHFRVGFGSACGFAGAAMTVVGENNGLAMGAAVLSLIAAATDLWNRENPNHIVDPKGMKYLALLHQLTNAYL
jgi:hypothetical protein